MNTKQTFTAMAGAFLLSGAMAYAQQGDGQAAGPRGDGPDGRPAGMPPPAQLQAMRGGPGCGGGACMMRNEGAGRAPAGGPNFGGAPRMERGPEGMDASQMRPRGRGPEGGHGLMPDPEHAKQAGATDQQIEAFKTFAFEQQTKLIDLRAAVEKAELALNHLMKSEAVDEKAALKAADALSQARGELFKQEIAEQVKVREILGADVLKKLHSAPPPRAQGPEQGRCCSAPNQAVPQPQGAAPAQGGNPPNPPAPAQGGNPPPPNQAK